VRLAVGLPTGVVSAAPTEVLDWIARIEAGPFSSVAVLDRVVSTGSEALAVLAVAAGMTQRVCLMASLIVGPVRETTLLARQAATIDALSGGRLTLGVAVGAREDDYAVTGADFHARGRRLDEQLPVLRRLWAAEPLSESIGPIGPTPGRAGGPQLLIGGYVPAVARRIAAHGDGFMAPGGGRPDQLADLWTAIVGAWEARGRIGRPRFVAATYFALGSDAPASAEAYIERMYGHDPALAARRLAGIPTTEAEVRRTIARSADLGADELILRPCGPGIDQVDRVADLVP
jgi:alkanesulfonate monooxygenase SsuD/methylene tetrahydromethanopterin reductase-like flavin-dependent oxidoreductase (luciferase family)